MFLSLVFHNHQPVGQLPWAFENAWRDSYAPFLEVLEKHPQIKVALHFTGPLLDWLCQHKPETVEQIRVLAARNQVEILGGGYYEPILAIWPHDDQMAQLRKLSLRIEELFGTKPRGMWLAERVWEPSLATSICQSELDFTFVDSTVFEAAGVRVADSFQAFSVAASNEIADANASANIEYSNAGKTSKNLAVFPINQPLRHIIPWRDAAESIEYLRGVREHKGDDAIVVFADDGEKFGGWPGTYDFVYTRGWLNGFFTLLEENAHWLQTIAPRNYLKMQTPAREIELPCGSYSEMQDWSGGNWRNFLRKYRESRDIHEEVLRVREVVKPAKNDEANDLILQAQSNDPLWHGAFGGLYLRHLRQSLYAKTVEAQVLVQENTPFARVSRTQSGDLVLENEQISLGVRAVGGHIWNWSSKIANHNLVSTLRRYREPYHTPGAPEDWYPRAALLDHFLGEVATLENFAQTRFPENGDFVSETWQTEMRSEAQSASVLLQRDGGVWHGGKHQPLSIQKTLTLQKGSGDIEIEYSIRNDSDIELPLWWANEWNIAMSGTDAPTRHFHGDDRKKKCRLDKDASFFAVTNPVVADSWLGLQAEWIFPKSVGLWHVPIWSVSQKEGGEIEKTHQSSAFVFLQRLHLKPQIEYSFAFKAALHSTRK